MNALRPDQVLPPAIRGRLQYHYRAHGAELRRFRLAVQHALEAEVGRLGPAFADGCLQAPAAPIVAALGRYIAWLGWCVWCCSHLAPPLGLTGAADARRLAAATLVYTGPRLIDDAIDGHDDYKGKHPTAQRLLARSFTGQAAADLRANGVLAGTWVILHGLRRLERHGGAELARAIQALCHRIAPGAILENLHQTPLTWVQYCAIVERKSVLYDQILYRALLDPVAEAKRAGLFDITAKLSALAQYLNDFNDKTEDSRRGQRSSYSHFKSDTEFWDRCRSQVNSIIAGFTPLPDALGNALAAALVETVDAAARLSPPSR